MTADDYADRKASLGYEKELWDAADLLRSNMDPAEYKHVVLGLLFLKYLSDAYEDRCQELRRLRRLEKPHLLRRRPRPARGGGGAAPSQREAARCLESYHEGAATKVSSGGSASAGLCYCSHVASNWYRYLIRLWLRATGDSVRWAWAYVWGELAVLAAVSFSTWMVTWWLGEGDGLRFAKVDLDGQSLDESLVAHISGVNPGGLSDLSCSALDFVQDFWREEERPIELFQRAMIGEASLTTITGARDRGGFGDLLRAR